MELSHRIIAAVRAAQQGFDAVRKRFANDPDVVGREGGYFCLVDVETGQLILLMLIGNLLPGAAEHHRKTCEARALQRLNNPEGRESGGVVRGCHFIYAFSGFSPKLDEALVLYAIRQHISQFHCELNRIAWEHGNKYWRELR